ncbi:YggS family pyridoxal phosphate-dependent enzyme [Domibacillus sp. DTU_2020_1001157_1_SI_ALB_TIR_016]|uniref:YggS family pyridoxal phosphate-dependent enzyme n=1 Tax=Domibacillus sp. DTU_2020_1001157_1_SI_ALB_TIR_016 TaxID=3077789 RepID=UPI0028E65B62|nr:YggS family pyridoxal phosphate-dependent enzyme [Domibacillus sp. DTU_2020_1001157_1_SI_ALB_TIR_016]WNS79795.1 YggS family pyridoxal phosphate-dependent enzyme [Domibacillus sp. DTU_2020_1001157_1_SI_ALB_TIR_016]
MKVSENVKSIKQRIEEAARRSGRQAEDVQIIAVTKYVTTARAQEAVEAGITHLGENRAEGLNEKYESIGDRAVWHFIGSLQTRKVKSIIHQADFIHSLDRASLAKEINSRAEKPVQCFVQVNVSGEESKQGLTPDEVIPFIQSLHIYEKIRVCGLMTMAPLTEDRDVLRSCFRKLALCKEEVAALNLPYAPCQELSMGMSNDFEIAVEEGATMIRIGTALVGE